MNDTAELMQRTVPLTWNKPEWMLPEAQTDEQKNVAMVSVLISTLWGAVLEGYFDLDDKMFHRSNGIDISDVEFWAYMPKHPNK